MAGVNDLRDTSSKAKGVERVENIHPLRILVLPRYLRQPSQLPPTACQSSANDTIALLGLGLPWQVEAILRYSDPLACQSRS